MARIDHLGRQPGANRQRRNVLLNNHQRTSFSLERQVWNAIEDIQKRENLTENELISLISKHKVGSSTSSAVRVFILTYFRVLAHRMLNAQPVEPPRLDNQPTSQFIETLERFIEEQKRFAS